MPPRIARPSDFRLVNRKAGQRIRIGGVDAQRFLRERNRCEVRGARLLVAMQFEVRVAEVTVAFNVFAGSARNS